MRSPVLIGALAALVVGISALVIVLTTALAVPPQAPTPGTLTPPPIAELSPTPLETPVPTATAGTTAPGETPSAEPTEPPEGGTGLGDQAVPIQLPALGGGTLDTSQYAGTPLWINFMATWCPQCVDELPMMELMQEQLGEGMQLALVDVGENEELVRSFVDALGVSLPVGLDRDMSTQQEWGAWVLPVHYMIDEEGIVRSIIYGGAPPHIFIESVINIVPDAELEFGE